MTRTLVQRAVVVCAVLGALGACSRNGAETAAAPTAAQAYVAMARGQVDVQGGLIRIAAPRDGTIAQLHGEPGSEVKAGDVLAQLDPKQAELAAGIAQAQLDQATARAAALRTQAAGLKPRAERAAEAAKAGAATQQSADDAQQALAETNAQLGEADAAVEAARRHLRQAQHEVAVLTIRAPVAARIVSRNAHLADVVSTQSGTALFTLLPDAPRIVRAELNEAFADKVSVGMRAEVVTLDGAGKTYPATVVRIGDVFGPSTLVEDPQEASDTRDVICILKLDSNDLRVGQRVQVRFKPL
ncbi:MAG: HlyD family efflux transporter periplasmic adaptor subunit [Xanthomonadaceae bacterium]|nr:HlyD family efflux transporter periplasmic adaptor subunit [Xanthomonadaceae bacterium]